MLLLFQMTIHNFYVSFNHNNSQYKLTTASLSFYLFQCFYYRYAYIFLVAKINDSMYLMSNIIVKKQYFAC